jgi:hypothetical protein
MDQLTTYCESPRLSSSSSSSSASTQAEEETVPWRVKIAKWPEHEVWDLHGHWEIQCVLETALAQINEGTRPVLDKDGCLRNLTSLVKESMKERYPHCEKHLRAGHIMINPPEDLTLVPAHEQKCAEKGYVCPMPFCQYPFDSQKKYERHVASCKNTPNRRQTKQNVLIRFPFLKYYLEETVIYRSLKYLAGKESPPKAKKTAAPKPPPPMYLCIGVPENKSDRILKWLGMTTN